MLALDRQRLGDRPVSHPPRPAQVTSTLQAIDSDLVALRRDLHAHPELSGKETRTTSVVAEVLSRAGLRVRPLAGTGLVADLGPVDAAYRVALRADLDALPLTEVTGLPWASRTDGVCHACGHDVHIAAVIGAGLALKAVEREVDSRGLGVRLLFQPAEEVMPGGAHDVIAQGGLDGVDRILGIHCDPTIDVGQVGLLEGPITAAADSVTVTLSGRGGHTSRPHLTQDLTYALGKVLTDVPAVLSRRVDPRAGVALVWGSVHAGVAQNVIPSTGQVSGTLRMLDAGVWEEVGPLIEETVRAVVAPYGVSAHLDHVRGVPPLVNDGPAIAALETAAEAVVGPDAVTGTRQSLGGEDFAWYLTRVPGAMARLGTRTPGGVTYDLHQGDLVVDERAIGVGASVLAVAALLRAGAGSRTDT
jgi:amidohydrolase